MPLRAADDNSPLSNGNGTGHNANDGDIGDVCASLAERVNAFLALDGEKLSPLLKAVQQQTRIALEVIGECLQRYSLEEISLSYNGGKDCLVLLILLLCALSPSHPSSSAPYHKFPLPRRLQSVYIISAHPFAEVDAFVDSSVVTYKLDLARYAMNMKEAFEVYLEEHKKVKAILVGTRRTDPHGEKLTHFDMTDKGWPSFMRVHPVIDWHYAEIWAFIRYFEVPYCTLYDQGYTSLGGTTDTHPNPALKAGQNKEQMRFRPAYELVEDDAERLGRDW